LADELFDYRKVGRSQVSGVSLEHDDGGHPVLEHWFLPELLCNRDDSTAIEKHDACRVFGGTPNVGQGRTEEGQVTLEVLLFT
jgi:hypothetical protein